VIKKRGPFESVVSKYTLLPLLVLYGHNAFLKTAANPIIETLIALNTSSNIEFLIYFSRTPL